MPRPQYSSNGIIRAIEMSRFTVTVLVEGFIDRMFFGSLLSGNAEAAGKVLAAQATRSKVFWWFGSVGFKWIRCGWSLFPKHSRRPLEKAYAVGSSV